jgi:hypothetical protein
MSATDTSTTKTSSKGALVRRVAELEAALAAVTRERPPMDLTRFGGQLNCSTNSGSAFCSYASLIFKSNFSVLSQPRG